MHGNLDGKAHLPQNPRQLRLAEAHMEAAGDQHRDPRQRPALVLDPSVRGRALLQSMSQPVPPGRLHLQRKHNVTWRTVRRAMDGQWPERRPPRRRESRLDPYEALIDGMLQADLDAPAKQRHTAQRIFDRLVERMTSRIRWSGSM